MNQYSNPAAKTPYAYNPASFDPAHALPVELQQYADDARLFVGLIVRKKVFQKEYRNRRRPVPLKAQYLRNQMHQTKYRQIIDALIAAGVVECDNCYIVGEKSMCYWLTYPYDEDRVVKVPLTSKPVLRRKAKDGPDIPTPIHAHLYRCLTETTLDTRASAWITKYDADHKPKHKRRRVKHEARVEQMRFSVEAMAENDWYFTVCPYGRLYTNITGLKRELRQHLCHNGRRVAELDVANSQPLLLALMLEGRFDSKNAVADEVRHLIGISDLIQAQTGREGVTTHLYDDKSEFLKVCEQGRFYDHLMPKMGYKDKQKAKVQILKRCLYCRNTSKYPEQEVFKKEFPEVWDSVQRIKKSDYRHLSWAMQRIESRFMFGVVKRLIDGDPDIYLATIHDGIVTTEDRADEVKQVMLEEFGKLGCNPAIKRK